jgi:photosystem II stability/assembly factor-like uncharacterized protein
VALAGEILFMSASTGPRGGRAALYRRSAGEDSFDKCADGLPEWFAHNIDSHHLAASAGLVVFGADGALFVSEDGGATWIDGGTAYQEITCVAIASGTGEP